MQSNKDTVCRFIAHSRTPKPVGYSLGICGSGSSCVSPTRKRTRLSGQDAYRRGRPLLPRLTRIVDNSWAALLALQLLAVLYVSVTNSNIGPLVLASFFLLLGFILICVKRHAEMVLVHVFVVVYSLNVLASCLAYEYFMAVTDTPFPYSWTDDDYSFDSKALAVYQSNLTDIPALRNEIRMLGSGTWHNADYYTIIIAWLYRGMDMLSLSPHPVYPRILNAFLLACVSVLVFRISQMCDMPVWSVAFSAYLCGLFPYMVFLAAHTYRDTFITLGITAMVTGLVAMFGRPLGQTGMRGIRGIVCYVLLLVFGITIISIMRSTYFLVSVILLFGSVVMAHLSKRFVIPGIVLVLALCIVAASFIFTLTGTDTETIEWSIEYYHTRHSDSDANITGAIFRMPYVVSIPFRFILRNVAPIPFPQHLLTESYSRLGTVLWFFLLPALMRPLLYTVRSETWDKTRSLRIAAWGFVVFYMWNIMSTLQDRHISTYLPMACILIAYNFAFNKRTTQKDLTVMYMIAMVLMILYASWRTLL